MRNFNGMRIDDASPHGNLLVPGWRVVAILLVGPEARGYYFAGL